MHYLFYNILRERKDKVIMDFKNIKKLFCVVMSAMLMFTGCGVSKDEDKKESVVDTDNSSFVSEEYNVAMLKGPTAMGFVKAWADSDAGISKNKYNVSVHGTADGITAGLMKDEVDIAAVPCNLASVLNSKAEGKFKLVAINTLGVLYMISDSDEIKEISDLKGKTIYSTGQGTTPEYTLNYILEKNGLVPGEDVKIEYKSEATEVAALMSNTKGAVAMLPQPYVTTVLANNEQFKIVLDMTEEWDKVSEGAPLITGVVVARTEVIDRNREAFDEFLKEYEASTKYVNENVEEAANMLEERDVFKAAVVKNAIPYCNIEFTSGDKLKEKVSSYLEILYNANSNSVGGKLPKEDFYLE